MMRLNEFILVIILSDPLRLKNMDPLRVKVSSKNLHRFLCLAKDIQFSPATFTSSSLHLGHGQPLALRPLGICYFISQ